MLNLYRIVLRGTRRGDKKDCVYMQSFLLNIFHFSFFIFQNLCLRLGFGGGNREHLEALPNLGRFIERKRSAAVGDIQKRCHKIQCHCSIGNRNIHQTNLLVIRRSRGHRAGRRGGRGKRGEGRSVVERKSRVHSIGIIQISIVMFLYSFCAFYIFPGYFDRFPMCVFLRKYMRNIHWRVSFYSPAIPD